MENVMTLLIAIVFLVAGCFIGKLIFSKNTKDFQLHFGIKGLDMSCSFYEEDKTPEK